MPAGRQRKIRVPHAERMLHTPFHSFWHPRFEPYLEHRAATVSLVQATFPTPAFRDRRVDQSFATLVPSSHPLADLRYRCALPDRYSHRTQLRDLCASTVAVQLR